MICFVLLKGFLKGMLCVISYFLIFEEVEIKSTRESDLN